MKRFFAFAPAKEGGDLGGTIEDRGDEIEVLDPPSLAPEDDKKAPLKNPFEEEEAKPEASEKKEPEEKSKAIPLGRHKQILEREREARADLERKLAQYQQGQKIADVGENLTKKEDKVLAMEKQYNALLADGEAEKAAALMSQIRRAEREIVQMQADMKIEASIVQATEAARYNIALERIEEAYPQLNPDAEEYSEELLADVADMKQVYQQRGMTPTEALQKAVKRLVGQASRDQEHATDVKPRVSEKDIIEERKKQAVKKTADAIGRTPPNTASIGVDSDVTSGALTAKKIMSMSQEEFAKIDEKQLAVLRGDNV